ncbi:MAG: FGGY-family carbohydrate kinase [Christensenellaceae bacterium]
MATKYILAHDFGTSGDKASLFTTEGKFIATKTTGYPSHTLNNGGVEQDPDDWWHAFCTSNKELTKDINVEDILCVGFDGTFPNCLCVDKDGNKLNNAYIWQDVRAVEECAELEGIIPAELLKCNRSGKIGANETLPKIYWIKKNEPEVFAKTAKIFPAVQDYIIYKLTGIAATEYSAAGNTTMMNVDHTDWSDELMSYVGVTRDMMPEIHKRTDIIGEVPEKYAAECGLAAGTKLVIGAGDTQCSMIGAGFIKPGDAYMNGGTSAGILALSKEGKMLGGLTASSGTSFSWLKNQICKYEQELEKTTGRNVYDIINEEIASAPVGSNGVMFHPYLAGERAPRNNGKAQGSFVGISLTTKREDILRSVIEGIGFNIGVIMDSVRAGGLDLKSVVIVGGLGKGGITRQIFADIMNVEIKVPKYAEEAATIGGAILGGIAMGLYKDEESALEKYLEIAAVTKPIPENVEKYAKLKPIFEKIYEGLYPVYPDIYDAKKWLTNAD